MTKTGNPFFDRDKKDKGAHGRKAEKKTSRRLQGVLQPGSGALPGAKGDIVTRQFLIENKTTNGESIRIELDWLLKIYAEALAVGQSPALAFQFVYGSGVSEHRNRWVCISEADFKELTED